MKNKVLFLFASLLLMFVFFWITIGLKWYLVLGSAVSAFLLFSALQDITQTKHSLKRNFPLLARLRWVFESERDKIRQYFNESDLDGTPFNRIQRSIVYQRSKNETETIPFGTQLNVYSNGYEFAEHSIFAKDASEVKGDRVIIGSKNCKMPYSSSIINISAMSYGSLSGAAVKALNLGAKEGGFAHNTGEGGISSYHLSGGDLIFQIGTGYFGAGKTVEGRRMFDVVSYVKNATRQEVKMIEVKLSQGAKPGHGGILPAKKNTLEIASIRGVEPFKRIDSPPTHSAFSDYNGMVDFIQTLRELSGGKPVGIKLCVGRNSEVESMISTFAQRDMYPDFITVDGSEGGTGSAPLEFTNNLGTPLVEGLVIVSKLLLKYNLKSQIKVIASGKVIEGFDMLRLMALGADGVNIARGFMLSLGCIQARECNKDSCPVGIATQNKSLERGLVVEHKYLRVKNYHNNTVEKFKELVGSMGLTNIADITPELVKRRLKNGEVESFNKIYEFSTRSKKPKRAVSV